MFTNLSSREVDFAPEERAMRVRLYRWFATGDFAVDLSLRVDPLSVTFLMLVTFVGTLIHVYSVGYMEHDPAKTRFFAYLNLFVASMLLVWTVGSWREWTVALGTGLIFCVLVPAVLHGREARVIGWMWQGRYIFPVLIGLPVLVAFVLQARLSHRRIPMGRRLLLSWALLFVVTHVAGLIITMHRYINGIYGSWRYITKDSWLPPVPLWGAGVAMVLFVIGMVVLLVRMVPAEDLGQDGLTADGDTPNIGVEIDNKGECKGSLNASLPESETELRTA